MCVRTSPEFKKKDKGPANPKREKKCQMTSLPSVFQLGSDQQWHFAEQKQKKGTLEPFKDFPAFLVDLQVADKGGSRQPYFVEFFPGRTWVYGVQRYSR